MEKASSRLKVLALLIALMFVALSTRLWSLQVLAAQDFDKQARDNSVRWVYSDPLRGVIYDDKGKPLVSNQQSLEVRVNRDALGPDGEAVVGRLAALLGVPVAQIVGDLQTTAYTSFQPITVASFVNEDVDFYISEHPDLFPGVTVEPTSVRAYPRHRLGAHMLGYVGPINGEEYALLKDQGYGLTDPIGRTGLEQVYEKYLRGQKGKQKFIVNSDADTIRALGAIPPTAGSDLYLTLDVAVQRAAEQELQRGMLHARTTNDSLLKPLKANAGAVVVLDVKTGGVVAMASLPSYDPTWYVKGLTKAESQYLNNGDIAPLIDRAVQLPTIPGSTFKPFTGLAAVHEGMLSLSGRYPCTTDYTHPGDTSGTIFHNWEAASSSLTFAEALKISCDTFFYRFGSDFYNTYVQDQLGADGERLQIDLRDWGFGRPTGVDLPAESSGLVPDSAWAQTRPDLFPDGWVPGGDILTMIGSTYVTVTPLQLATAFSAIGNGGELCRPYLVDRIVAADGTVVKQAGNRCDQRLPYTAQQLDYVRNALATVTTGGTATCAFAGFPMSQVQVAGKTGTAERPPFQDTSWFASIVGPPGDPQYAVVAMVEQGGFGSQTAAPIVRRVIEDMYGLGDTGTPGCLLADR